MGVGLGIDIGYQILLDVGNPYLTGKQIAVRAIIGQGSGSFVSWAVGSVLIGGPVGFVVGIGISIVWDIYVAPWIYENRDAEPTRELAPIS